MKIVIETIPHNEQRYPTVGDWFYDADGTLRIKVSNMENQKYEELVAVHELIEVLLCKHQDVSQEAVDTFDMEFEKQRDEGNLDEPGDAPEAPYRRQHCLATAAERLLAAELDVSWKEYEDAVESL